MSESPKDLSEIAENTSVRVISYSIQNYTYLKLAQIGMIPGEVIKVIRKSSLGGTLLIEIANSLFCIRNSLAKNIIVQAVHS